MLYRLLYKHVLAKTDPEQAHSVAMRLIGAFGRSPLARLSSATVGRLGGDRLRGLLARPVPGRLGLAAGQDKNATAVLGTIAMGFAFTEVGTVTPLPGCGNGVTVRTPAEAKPTATVPTSAVALSSCPPARPRLPRTGRGGKARRRCLLRGGGGPGLTPANGGRPAAPRCRSATC